MKKNLKFFLCLIVGLSSLAQTNDAQDELKFVPENRVFLQHSQKTNTVPMYLDTADATGECGIGLWVDEQLSIVLYPQERSALYLSPGPHKIRASYEPLPENPQTKEEKDHYKYCKKKKPENLGVLKEFEIKNGEPAFVKIRSNQGYLYRIKMTEKNDKEK